MVFGLSVPAPQISDAHPAGETDSSIHHEELAVSAIVDARDVVPAQRMIALHLHPGGFQVVQILRLDLSGSHPVQEHMHLDPGFRTFA